jgi:hypothetical protein
MPVEPLKKLALRGPLPGIHKPTCFVRQTPPLVVFSSAAKQVLASAAGAVPTASVCAGQAAHLRETRSARIGIPGPSSSSNQLLQVMQSGWGHGFGRRIWESCFSGRPGRGAGIRCWESIGPAPSPPLVLAREHCNRRQMSGQMALPGKHPEAWPSVASLGWPFPIGL